MAEIGKLSRRAALGVMARSTVRVSTIAVLPAAAMAATAPKGDDAEIIALSAEVLRRCRVANAFNQRIEPLAGQWRGPGPKENLTEDECWARVKAWSEATGRDGAIKRLQNFDEETDRIYHQMMAIPATTQPGRAAKVRALLVHVMGREWRGPDSELEWEVSEARTVLGELAGMSAEELADV
jgi:hypothetical protein